MTSERHPLAPHQLPAFFTAPGETDVLMAAMAIFLIAVVFGIGLLYFAIHAIPEHLAHRGRKLQFELVAVLSLLALFTHNGLFWVAALLLAVVDLPDVVGPLRRIADAAERLSPGGALAEAVPKAREPGREDRADA